MGAKQSLQLRNESAVPIHAWIIENGKVDLWSPVIGTRDTHTFLTKRKDYGFFDVIVDVTSHDRAGEVTSRPYLEDKLQQINSGMSQTAAVIRGLEFEKGRTLVVDGFQTATGGYALKFAAFETHKRGGYRTTAISDTRQTICGNQGQMGQQAMMMQQQPGMMNLNQPTTSSMIPFQQQQPNMMMQQPYSQGYGSSMGAGALGGAAMVPFATMPSRRRRYDPYGYRQYPEVPGNIYASSASPWQYQQQQQLPFYQQQQPIQQPFLQQQQQQPLWITQQNQVPAYSFAQGLAPQQQLPQNLIGQPSMLQQQQPLTTASVAQGTGFLPGQQPSSSILQYLHSAQLQPIQGQQYSRLPFVGAQQQPIQQPLMGKQLYQQQQQLQPTLIGQPQQQLPIQQPSSGLMSGGSTSLAPYSASNLMPLQQQQQQPIGMTSGSAFPGQSQMFEKQTMPTTTGQQYQTVPRVMAA